MGDTWPGEPCSGDATDSIWLLELRRYIKQNETKQKMWKKNKAEDGEKRKENLKI